MTWHFEEGGFCSGVYNMRRDEELAQILLGFKGASTVRVYGWNPPAISLGWNQSFDDIDLEKAAGAGIDVVRRPTGGRAILHSEELTYAVALMADGRNVLSLYADISRALVTGLRVIGIDASFERLQPHFPSLYRSVSSVACFTSSARSEITVRGRKLVGSAQRRFKRSDGEEVVLQHGSILMGPDHKRIVEFLKRASGADIDRLERELGEKTTDLESELGTSVAFEELTQAIRQGFEQTWNLQFETVNSKRGVPTASAFPSSSCGGTTT